MMERRGLLGGLTLALAMPALVRPGALMRVSSGSLRGLLSDCEVRVRMTGAYPDLSAPPMADGSYAVDAGATPETQTFTLWALDARRVASVVQAHRSLGFKVDSVAVYENGGRAWRAASDRETRELFRHITL